MSTQKLIAASYSKPGCDATILLHMLALLSGDAYYTRKPDT
jgi:hypothetical protein